MNDWKKYINKVNCMDAMDLLKMIPDKSIDLVLTDPPYGVKKAHWDEYDYWKDLMKKTSKEIDRTTKNDGFIIIFCATRFLKETINFFKTPYRWQFIWYCSNNMISGDMGFAKYTSALIFSRAKSIHKNLQDVRQFPAGTNELKNINHPTPKPLEIIEYLSIGYSKENQLILDPFMGSWTTAVACQNLKRNFIGAELDESYCEIGRQRLRQQTLF